MANLPENLPVIEAPEPTTTPVEALTPVSPQLLPADSNSDFDFSKVVELELQGGFIYAWDVKRRKRFRVYDLLGKPFVLVPDKLHAVHINLPFTFSQELFFIASKIKEVNGTATACAGNEQLKVQLSTGNVPFVTEGNMPGGKRRFLVVNQRQFSKIEKIGIGFGIGLAALACAGLAIVSAPLAVAALGFGAGGIVAGSTAASMMSEGFIGVATLQSIGAAGMGISATLVAGTAGAATAGIASGIAYSVKPSTGTKWLPHQVERVLLYERTEAELEQTLSNLMVHIENPARL